MKKLKLPGLGLLATLALAPSLSAQDVPGAVPGAVPAAAPAKNLWSFFCLTPEQAARCKEKLCNSPLGEMLKGMAGPVSLMSGGLIGGKCGTPTAADMAKLAAEGKLDGAEGSAAQIKKSEAEAKARREAIRYLGTVDCNYWENAKKALINGLRGDPSECVRYEAALALLRGCCCNKLIMEALKHSANGDDKDGFPAEDSSRVREAAAEALARCAAVVVELAEPLERRKQKEKEKELVNPPLAHGKGLAGILASATAPAKASTASKAPLPAIKDQTASTMAPPPQWHVTQQPEKKGLIHRLGSGANSSEVQVREWSPSEVNWPTTTKPNVTSVSYQSAPPAPANKAANTYPNTKNLQFQGKESHPPELLVPLVNEIPVWNRPLPQGPSQKTTAGTPSTGNHSPPPALQPYTPGEESVVPSRGIVIFDASGASR